MPIKPKVNILKDKIDQEIFLEKEGTSCQNQQRKRDITTDLTEI